MKRKQVGSESEDDVKEEDEGSGEEREEGEEETEEIDEDGNIIRRRAVERPTFIRGDDGYVSGSITRISLYNFMTYEKCTIRPGPSLNMIIGPNGTGKSTLSSAILIGLGFPPSFLGRSNKGTNGFIRLGQPFSEVEIELRAKDGRSSLTIFRKFGIDKVHNEFRINGEVATKQKVVEVVAELGIVANLCNYLPQDKVASFAAMAPPQLLQETMGAAGNPNLLKWHGELVNKGKEYDLLCEELEQLEVEREKEQQTVDQLRPEKEQYEARQELELRVRICKARRNWVQYLALREACKNKRRELRDASRRFHAVREINAPLQQMNEELVQRARDIAQQLNDAEQAGHKLQGKMAECRKKIDEKDAATAGAQNSLNNLKRAAKEYRGKITKEEVKLKQAMALQRPAVDPVLEATEKAKRSDLNAKMRDLQQQQSQLQQSEKLNQNKADQISRELTDLGSKIAAVNNVRSQREAALCREEPSIAFTIKWLADHRDEFEHEVLLPPAISVDVTDPRYAAQVESCMPYNATRTFVCQSQKDFARLDKLIGTPLGAGQRGQVRIHTSYQDPLQAQVQQPPLTEEEMQASGLDGYAADFVTGPEPLLRFLDQTAGFRRKGVTLRGEREINDSVAQKLAAYATKDTRTTMHFSNYGGGTMSDTSSLGRARYFTHVVNKDEVAEIQSKIQRGNDNRRQLEEDGKTLRQRQEAVQHKLHDMQEKINALADATGKRLKALKEYSSAQNNIRASQDRIQQYRQKADIEAESAKFKERIAAGGKVKLAEIVKYNSLFAKNAENVHLIMRTGLELCQANTNKEHVNQACRGRQAESLELQGLITGLQEQEKTGKEDATACYASWERRIAELDDHADRLHAEIAQDQEAGTNQTEADWDELVAEANAELQANTGYDPSVVKRFNKHFELLTAHHARLQVLKRRQARMRSGLDAVLDKFIPALDDLISVVHDKFSAAFEYFGCAGKVELNRTGDDYASWGIHIYVRYRDATPLELLTATRQSGGERALATISFLMSLTEMARVPFSLVDEINQGMDSRAERHVHNRLVKVTCDPEAGQYFLITPKLLTNLEYHPRMTVLNVFNGSFMGKGAPNAGNVKATLTSYRKRFRLV